MVRQSTFIDYKDRTKIGVKGTWEWRWNRIDFVELVFLGPSYTKSGQLKFDF